jgi:hypothetical protein
VKAAKYVNTWPGSEKLMYERGKLKENPDLPQAKHDTSGAYAKQPSKP